MSVNMTVAAGFGAGLRRSVESGNNVFKIGNQPRETFRLRAQRQQALFEIEIEGQGTGEIKRENRGVRIRKILFRPSRGQQLRMQLHGPFRGSPRRRLRFVFDHGNFSPQERALLIDGEEFEPLPALGDQIELTIGILLHDRHDFRGAAHIGEALFQSSHHPKAAAIRQALGNHFLVTRFEDVQRQRRAGE